MFNAVDSSDRFHPFTFLILSFALILAFIIPLPISSCVKLTTGAMLSIVIPVLNTASSFTWFALSITEPSGITNFNLPFPIISDNVIV